MIRGHQEDERAPPKTAFDVSLTTWRVGEALLHAANMARELGDPSAKVTIITEWTELAGRTLIHLEGRRLIFDHYRAQQENFRNNLTVAADQISDALPELVRKLITPLYELFDFFKLPEALPAEELARMRAHRF
jgi:hypothetical protein